jgi:hypothetical protein
MVTGRSPTLSGTLGRMTGIVVLRAVVGANPLPLLVTTSSVPVGCVAGASSVPGLAV